MSKYLLGLVMSLLIITGMNSGVLADEVGGPTSGKAGEFKLELKMEEFTQKVETDKTRFSLITANTFQQDFELLDTEQTMNRLFLKGSYNINEKWTASLKLGKATTSLKVGQSLVYQYDPGVIDDIDSYYLGSNLTSESGSYLGLGIKGVIHQAGDFTVSVDFQLAQQSVTDVGQLAKTQWYDSSVHSYYYEDLKVTDAKTTSYQLALVLAKKVGELDLYGGPKLYFATTTYKGEYRERDTTPAWAYTYKKSFDFESKAAGFMDNLSLFGGVNWTLKENMSFNFEIEVGGTVGSSAGVAFKF